MSTTMPGPEPSDDELDLLRWVKLQPGEFASVNEVNEKTSVGYRQTRNRLDDMVEKDLLNVRNMGTVNAYWPADGGEELLNKTLDD